MVTPFFFDSWKMWFQSGSVRFFGLPGALGKSMDSSFRSSRSAGNGHDKPAVSARTRMFPIVPWESDKLRAMALSLNSDSACT